MAEFREVYPRVLSLALPLPFELESVNVYLVALDDGYLLIDCGMETEPAFETLDAAMRSAASPGPRSARSSSRTCIPITWAWPRACSSSPAPQLAMHQAEARHLRMVTGADRRFPWLDIAYTQAGVPKALEEMMDEHFVEVRKNFHQPLARCAFSGGEEIPTALGPLEVLWTSGHSPGHICLYSRERKLLFSGDQILENITPNIAWHPGRDMLGEFLESLSRLAALDSRPDPAVARRAFFADIAPGSRKPSTIIASAATRFST